MMSLKSLWGFSAIPVLWSLYHAHSTTLAVLSPQGCRVPWISPSFIVQNEFNTTWTPLAHRYSLLLYREVGWDSPVPSGRPVLFIPGNAGSSRQVRWIASSAARQYYSQPGVRSVDLASGVEPLDIYAAEFNEDLSALHGPTLQMQTAYIKAALEYIVSRYPDKQDLQVTLLGHSMGGIVALNALESGLHSAMVSATITMSSPHSLPPARLDREIERVFSASRQVLWDSASLNCSTRYHPPVLAICGGAVDNMLPMESCVLPSPLKQYSPNGSSSYRRTIFTSGLEGTWTGVGHREIVWCQQVCWRVARAALELAKARPDTRGSILDRWFASTPKNRESHYAGKRPLETSTISDTRFVLDHLPPGISAYRFPITKERRRLVLLLARGCVSGTAPEKETLAEAFVDICEHESEIGPRCKPVAPEMVRLLPNPPTHEPFPAPGEGADESEGVVAWEGEPVNAIDGYFIVTVNSTGRDGFWLAASLEPVGTTSEVFNDISLFAPVLGVNLPFPDSGQLVRRIWIPNLVSNAMIVYRVTFEHKGDCDTSLLAPLLLHTSSEAEYHFHRTRGPENSVRLHTHNAGPFLRSERGINLTFYSSGECRVTNARFTVDWNSSIGRATSRLWAGAFSFAVGHVSAINAFAWYNWDGQKQFPIPQRNFEQTVRQFAVPALLCITVLSILPLPPSVVLGLGGEPVFFMLAPVSLCIAAATVSLSCYLLDAVQFVLGQIIRIFVTLGMLANTNLQRHPFTELSMVSYTVLSGLAVDFIPYQIAYLVSFLLHLWYCSDLKTQLKHKPQDLNLLTSYAQASHLLLLLFWLLPLVAPVWIVWARMLINAGITTPLDGNHNILNIAFIVMSVELGGNRPSVKSTGVHRNTLVVSYAFLSFIAVVLGARYTYILYLFFNMCCLCFVVGTMSGIQGAPDVPRQ